MLTETPWIRRLEPDAVGSHPCATGGHASATAPRRALQWWRSAAPWLSLLWLSLVVNVTYPARQPVWSLFVPAIDVVVLLGLYALLARSGRRTGPALHALIVGFFVLVRLLRVGDGLKLRYFNREFNATFDLSLVPELARLLASTLPPLSLALVVMAIPLSLGLLAFSVARALRTLEASLAQRRVRRGLALVLVGVAAASVLALAVSGGALAQQRSFAFTPSAVPRFASELVFFARANDYRRRQRQRLDAAQQHLVARGANLRGLERQHVLLFLVESYGETLVERPLFRERTRALYRRLEQRLGAAGFHTASAVLESPTYGGGSWYAHASLATGARIDNQLDHQLVSSIRPRTLPRLIGDAGYRTVVVQPGTTRPVLGGDFLGFEQAYYSWSLGYRGPKFAWAPMPDQYVLDVFRRRELELAREPLFLCAALVSSHAPWSTLPPLIDDWSLLGDGRLFHERPPVRIDAAWSDLSGASLGYFAAIEYDLELLTRFVVEFVEGDALVLWAGDHQPAPDVTAHSPKAGVPVHVISRRAAFLEPFRARGYRPGLMPERDAARLPMESLLVHLLEDFSRPGELARGPSPSEAPGTVPGP